MTKAFRQMKEDIKLIDLVIELLDARIPVSSKNPDIDKIAGNKPRVVLLNKSDMADKRVNRLWIEYFKEKSFYASETDSRSGDGLKTLNALVKEACSEKLERDKRRGILNRPLRAMVVGIPNVGKSTFINSFAKKAVAKTGNKPGVTKGKQWIRLNKTLELLDTPGILWPKFEDEKVGEHLALTGSINDDILDMGELSAGLVDFLLKNYPDALQKRYGIEINEDTAYQKYDIIEKIGNIKSIYCKGGEIDYNRVYNMVLDDFRSGRLGRISLETPEELK